MTIDINPTHPGDAPITTHLCPCTEAYFSSSDPLPAEWIPLDSLTQDFAAFAHEATTASALQAAGSAFHALSDEVCAHQCYSLSVRSLFPARLGRKRGGLEQTIRDLESAIASWSETAYWLARTAEEDEP